LKRIIVKLEVAGRTFEQKLDPLPNQKAEFVWDGLDHLGRPITGPTTAHVSAGYMMDSITVQGVLNRHLRRQAVM
jgi:hypothetical protein